MTRLITFIFFIYSFTSYAQLGRLTLEIQSDTRQDSICRNLFITYSSDTIFLERIRLEAYLGYTKVLDSLNPGEYKIYLYGSPDSAELYTLRKFKIYPDKNTRLNIESFVNEESFEIDKKTQLDISKEVGLMEYYGSYSNSSYLISSSPIKDNYGIGFNAGLWSKFGKNCGAIIGNGFGLNYYRFSKDTTLIALPQLKKISESYLNLNWNSNLRLRFTIKNQLLVNLHNYKIAYFDLGVNYALPIVFNHIISYQDSKRLINKRIHQFTDFRPFLGLGYRGIQIFAEYRIFDYLLGYYTEVPKLNVGLKISLISE